MADDDHVWLLYGSSGWLGGQMRSLLEQRGKRVVCGRARLEHRESLAAEITQQRATRVVNCAGLTGRPNVDWCESHKEDTIRVNVVGVLNLVDVCWQLGGVHVLHLGSGCIYNYDAEHAPLTGRGYREDEAPNFAGSFYSETRALCEQLLRRYSNVLVLRLRMPISDDLHPRSLLTKLLHYDRLLDVPNSVSVLSDLLPVAVAMADRAVTGVYNFVNPGVISHSQLLDLYRDIVDPRFAYSLFPADAPELHLLMRRRSNCELDCSKLLAFDPTVPPVSVSIVRLLHRLKKPT